MAHQQLGRREMAEANREAEGCVPVFPASLYRPAKLQQSREGCLVPIGGRLHQRGYCAVGGPIDVGTVVEKQVGDVERSDVEGGV